MKSLAIVAAAACCLGAALAHAQESPLDRALRAPATPAPLVLAQADRKRPTCKDDEKDMPRGSKVCRLGRVLVCTPQGSWQDTGASC